jgi:hypothetical protein
MLNAYALPEDVALRGSESRGRILEILISEFRAAFAGIKYEVDTKTRIVNAQAFGLGRLRFVRLYGGFAFHPIVNEDALVFTMLHETGHHLAPGRRFAGDPRLACDCIADRWAVGVGARTLRRSSGRALDVNNALESLDATIASIAVDLGNMTAGARRRSGRPQDCWAEYWPMRKLRLTGGNTGVPSGPCYYSC